jgi:molecular chaperone HscB
VRLDADDFELFGLERRFELQRGVLDERWRVLQAEVHPDRFAVDGAPAQRVALQWAVRVNEAYQRLKDPLPRAAYLCELAGQRIDAESNTAMPKDFLVKQMAWREALDDAQLLPAVEALAAEVDVERRAGIERLKALIDGEHRLDDAAQQVRALMFVERFAGDVDRRLEALGQ